MPDNTATINSNTATGSAAHEERSRLALITTAKTINWKGHNVLDAEGKVVTTTSAIHALEERNPDLLKVHSSVVMKHFVFLFGLVCVYFIDVLLFGATAEYVASLITGNWMLVLLAKYGVPLFFLGIEVLISLKMMEAREARESEEVPTYGW
ncbi:MAG TPA: hypothetical protein VF698_18545 [Thermoanaerobaculia bacterium]|jgi:hypothetical protein